MKTWKRSALALLLLPAAFCWADTPTTAAPTIADIVAHRVARLTTLLTLTTAQQATATTLFTTEETALAAIRTSRDTAQTALTTAIEANDKNGIVAAATQFGSFETQEVEADATAQAGFYASLTADQKTKYKTLLEGGGGDGGRGGGPGGPHHP